MSKNKESIPKSERSEIVNNILGAKDRKEQLKIEADLHLTSVTTIKEILKDYGVNLKIFNGGSRKKKHIEDVLAEEQEIITEEQEIITEEQEIITEEQEIITPVEEIKAVEEQAEPDEIGQAWADLSIPPDAGLTPLTAEPLPPMSNEERVCEPIPVEQAEKIPYTKPEIIEPPLPKSSNHNEKLSQEDLLSIHAAQHSPLDEFLYSFFNLRQRRRELIKELREIEYAVKECEDLMKGKKNFADVLEQEDKDDKEFWAYDD